MNRLKGVFLGVYITFRKQLSSPRLYLVFAIVVMFHYYSFAHIKEICEYLNVGITPWVFPFFMGNPMFFMVYGGLAMLLYCDAPFLGTDAPFIIHRMGRTKWLLAQMIYIYLSAFVYTIIHVFVSIVMLVPQVGFSTDWGSVIYILAQDATIFNDLGVPQSFTVSSEFLESISPISAMAISILLFWLGTVFIGMIILCFKVCVGGMFGIVLNGFWVSLAYFTPYLGKYTYGYELSYFSPIFWSSIQYLDLYQFGRVPTPQYAVGVYLISIIIMTIVAIMFFNRRDVCWEEV